MKRLLLTTAVLIGFAAPAVAATIEFEGNTYHDQDTVLDGRVGETTRGYYFFDPCSVAGWADECYNLDFPSMVDTDESIFGFVGYRGLGNFILMMVDFTPAEPGTTYVAHFVGEIWTGRLIQIDEDEYYWETDINGTGMNVVATSAPAVPLPATGILAAAGLGLLGFVRRRRTAT